jgi:hypothetical protein
LLAAIKQIGQRQLTALDAEEVARLIASRLDRARPLSELYVMHGLQDGPRRC